MRHVSIDTGAMRAASNGAMRLDMEPYLKQRFFMPAETAPHDACWIAWPSREAFWGERLAAVRREHALVARTVARFEPVVVVCREQDAADVRAQCGGP